MVTHRGDEKSGLILSGISHVVSLKSSNSRARKLFMSTNSKFLYAILFVFLILFAEVPSFSSIAQAQTGSRDLDREYWFWRANNAWQYFQPGVGVDPDTGLHRGSDYWHYFTGWDLGTYIFAILDAEQLGIIYRNSSWGADYRIEKVLSWLETMELTPNGVPYSLYDSDTGLPASNGETNISDYGNLLIALHRLQVCRPDLTERINQIVNSKINSAYMVSMFSAYADHYNYYVAHGFAYFGYDSPQISAALNLLNTSMNQPQVTVYGVELPKIYVGCESLLLGMFNLETQDPLQTQLMRAVYAVSEARYNATGKLTAFSEGNTELSSPSYVYEWIVTPTGASWQIEPAPTVPIVYFKVAVGFQALYNTSYSRSMVSSLENRLIAYNAWSLTNPVNGYFDGVDENDRMVSTLVDKTNGLILNAARYAMQAPDPTPTQPSPSPSLSPSSSPTATPTLPPSSPTPSHSITPSPSPSVVPPTATPFPSASTPPPTSTPSPSATPTATESTSPSTTPPQSTPTLNPSLPLMTSSPVSTSPIPDATDINDFSAEAFPFEWVAALSVAVIGGILSALLWIHSRRKKLPKL
jgi:hypothetical protein